MKITAGLMPFDKLNDSVRSTGDAEIIIDDCNGQRYIGAGSSDRKITINGIAGNATGSYLNGTVIDIYGNAQDAVGDTMNDGEINIFGSSGDATGYAMRGGRILVRGSAGYRAGIHMKSYRDKVPVVVIGGAAGSFLGEYQAGGLIIVLGLGSEGRLPFGYFCGTGMHGGKMLIRSSVQPAGLPSQVLCSRAADEELAEFAPHIAAYCLKFGVKPESVYDLPMWLLTPNTKNPYKQLYTQN